MKVINNEISRQIYNQLDDQLFNQLDFQMDYQIKGQLQRQFELVAQPSDRFRGQIHIQLAKKLGF